MKLASLKHGRDGRLVVVSRDLARCADVAAVAPTLQAVLDDWEAAEPQLTEVQTKQSEDLSNIAGVKARLAGSTRSALET